MSFDNSVAIIPARSGSKRIPNKNIREFHGKPMLQYSIEAALRSELFRKVVVSTDSEVIAELARKLGAEVPFIRPAKYSDDHTPLADVLTHALLWLKENDQTSYDYVCCLLATAPFVRVSDLKASFEKLTSERVPAVIPVTSFPFPIFRAFKRDRDDGLSLFWPEHEMTRSNDLPEAYHDAGQFYWLNVESFLSDKKIFAKGAKAFPIPRHRVQDIDTLEDWERAEKIFSAEQKSTARS